MHHFLLTLVLLLSACTPHQSEPVEPPPKVPADLLQPVPGYTGPQPTTEHQMKDALVAEKRGREAANAQLVTIDQILQGATPH